MPALYPLTGIVNSMQVSCRGTGKRLDSHQQPRFIHHHEHGPHALVLLAQKQSPALAFASKRHRAGGIAVNAHFLFHAGANHIVELSQTAIFVDPDFGNDKQ